MKKSFSARCGRCWRLAVLAGWVAAPSPLAWGQAATTAGAAPKAEAEHGGGTPAGDETAVGIANALRDYFASENFKPDSIVANHQLAENTILVFRGSDDQKRTVLLVLSGVAASARSEEKKAPKPSPLTLELSYIEDAARPDVFRIGKGQF